MTAEIVNLLATDRTPRYRPMPTAPAEVILLPQFLPELTLTQRLQAVRSKPVQQIETAIRVSLSVERRVRATISEYERKLRDKYHLANPFDGPFTEKPCDS